MISIASSTFKWDGCGSNLNALITRVSSPVNFLSSISVTRALISIEEHSISGGLGEKCASIIAQNHLHIPFQIVGIPDEYMMNGSQSDVLDYYNMEPSKLASIAKKLISK